jgi:[acyl-carrier-protein] S-malonyltransferase
VSKRAFIFPGQGSQAVGMGQDIYEAYAQVRELYQQAGEILGFDLAEISFSGPEEVLRQTRYTQPALYVHGFALFQLAEQRGLRPDAVAGHSLGEFTALAAAGAWKFEAGLRVVKLRAELMHQASDEHPGTMAAVLGLEDEVISRICEQVSAQAMVVPANYNSPGQVVISGTETGVHQALLLAEQAGAKRTIRLNVSGAFHSPQMLTAKPRVAQALCAADIQRPIVPVYCNVTAEACDDPVLLAKYLEEQLVHPVQWARSISRMIGDGIKEFWEVGSGTVLSGLVRKIDRQVRVAPISRTTDLDALPGS